MRILIACAIAPLLAGCFPVKQPHVTGGQGYDDFGYVDSYCCSGGYGLLQIGPSNVHKTVAVIDAESYAIGPDGERYGVVSKPHPYDVSDPDPRAPYVRDRIYLLTERGRRLWSWRDGDWRFVFALQTPHGRTTRTFNLSHWTFYYSPFLHGPPN